MKRWAGLLALFVLAAIGAVAISVRMQPSDLERRHGTIRVGMTASEAAETMNPDDLEMLLPDSSSGITSWSFLQPPRFMEREVHLEVYFDARNRVVRTSVNGKQLRP